MNNEEKNTYVKVQITNALIALLKEKSIESISVSELTNKAQVGRVSFYRNYKSKEDVLMQESQRLLSQWGDLFADKSTEEYNSFFLSLFDFFKQHEEFYSALYRSGMSEIIMKTIVSTADVSATKTNLDAYLKSFWAYGVYGWVIEWIERGMQESGQELFELFQTAHNT